MAGLDGFPLESSLPPSFLQQPAQEFEIAEWQVGRQPPALFLAFAAALFLELLVPQGHPLRWLLDQAQRQPMLLSSSQITRHLASSHHHMQSVYPLNYLVGSGVSRAAPGPDPGAALPSLRLLSRQPAEAAGGTEEEEQQQQQQQQQARLERLELEMDTGKGGSWGVINITGEVFQWSLSSRVANSELPGVSRPPACLPISRMPLSLMSWCRLATLVRQLQCNSAIQLRCMPIPRVIPHLLLMLRRRYCLSTISAAGRHHTHGAVCKQHVFPAPSLLAGGASWRPRQHPAVRQAP